MQHQVAIALSGGGSKGDFEVGALRYLYDHGVRPNIVTGSSVGAINALKLAEGDDPEGDNAQLRLERIWRGLRNEHDMYELEPWMQTIQDLRIRDMLLRGLGGQGSSAVASWLRLPALAISGLISSGLDVHALADAFTKASRATSIYNLGPVERLIRTGDTFDPHKLARSGIKLRLAVVGLESGLLRHVDEHGEIFGVESGPVDLVDAAIASASIPMMFPPRLLAGEHYVDGGTRQILPLVQAIQAGATEVYGITAAQKSLPTGSFANETLIGIGARAVGDLMVDEITDGDIREALAANDKIRLTVIRPTVDVHNVITIDPGLIDISIDYGFMRAADHLAVPSDHAAEAMALSDDIIRLRMECWRLEESFATSRPRQLLTSADRNILSAIRSFKRDICDRAEARQRLGAPLPEGCESWWLRWELHREQPSPATPWERAVTTFGPLPDETPPSDFRR